MPFKDISYLELWQPSSSTERNNLGSFSREHYELHFCETILKLNQWSRRRCHFNIFFIYSSGCHLVWQSGTFL